MKQLNKEQCCQIKEQQCTISKTVVKTPRADSTSSQYEWDLVAQHEAFASWKAAKELAQSTTDNELTCSIQGDATSVEAQHAALESWEKAHKTAHQGSESSGSAEEVLSPELSKKSIRRNDKPHKKHWGKGKNKQTRKEKPSNQKPANPVHMMVDKTLAQGKLHHKRHKTPKVMEPVTY
ncbi:hypothetical protein V8B97DRAFT_1915822 [Scleroderma yunnanense]